MNATGPAESRRQKNYKKSGKEVLTFVAAFAILTKLPMRTAPLQGRTSGGRSTLKTIQCKKKEAKAIEGGGSCREIAAQDFEDDQAKESEQRRPESGSPEGKKREGSRRD